MKILHTVETYYPNRNGMAEVVRQISERLVCKGHRVVVATGYDPERELRMVNGVEIVQFKITGKAATGIKGEIEGYQQFILKSDADLIVNFAAQQWATDLVLPIIHELKMKTILVPTGFSEINNRSYVGYFEMLQKKAKSYHGSIYHSTGYRDIKKAQEWKLANITVIENGACEKEFNDVNGDMIRKDLGVGLDEFLIIHISGYLNKEKGHLEAIKIFSKSSVNNSTLILVSKGLGCRRDILRLKIGKVRSGFYLMYIYWLVFVYKRINRLKSRRIKVIELERNQIVRLYKAADLLLFPSHIECSPLVIFEACASETPFVASDVGNIKEIAEWTKGGVVLRTNKYKLRSGEYRYIVDLKSSVREVNDLFENKKKRQELARNGVEAWRSRFTWKEIADKYEEYYFKIVSGCYELN